MARERGPRWRFDRTHSDLKYAFFLSYVREDVEQVLQLKAAITAASGRGGRPTLEAFVDRHNWPAVNELSAVIRRFILHSRFLVAWITPAFLANVRGWVWLEFAYAELIESIMVKSSVPLQPAFLVPIFRNVTVADVERTPLLRHWQRSLVPPGEVLTPDEIARRLVDFYDQQDRLTLNE